MNATTKTALVIAFAIVVVILLLFGGGAMTGVTLGGGMMGNGEMGNGEMGIGAMSGISWMWISALLMLGLGAVLIWILFGKKSD